MRSGLSAALVFASVLATLGAASPRLVERLGPFDGPGGSIRLDAEEPCIGDFAAMLLPGGTQLLSLGEKQLMTVCDLRSGTIVRRWQLDAPPGVSFSSSASIDRLVLSPDGRWLGVLWKPVSGSEAWLAVWPLGANKAAWPAAVRFEAGRNPTLDTTIFFTPDSGRLVLGSDDGATPLRLFSTESGEVRAEIPGVALGAMYGAPAWGFHSPGPWWQHPLLVEPRPIGGLLYAAGGARCPTDEPCEPEQAIVTPPTVVNLSTGRAAPLVRSSSAPAIVTDTIALEWVPEDDDGAEGHLLLRDRLTGAVRVDSGRVPVPIGMAAEVEGRGRHVAEASWGPDGTLAVALRDRALILDLVKGAIVRTVLPPATILPTRVLTAPGAPLAVTWVDVPAPRFEVMDVATGAAVAGWAAPDHRKVEDLSFSADDQTLVARRGDEIELYRLADPPIRTRWRPAPPGIEDVALTLRGWLDADTLSLQWRGRGGVGFGTLDVRTGAVRSWRAPDVPGAPDRGDRYDASLSLQGGVIAVRARAAGRFPAHLMVTDARTGVVRWGVDTEPLPNASLRVSPDGTVVCLQTTCWATADGASAQPFPSVPRVWVTLPRQEWGADVVRSHDGSVIAEATWLGAIRLYRGD